jgi:hypothetical protein
MDTGWPDAPPEFPADFTSKQLEAFRILTRYAVGFRNKAYVFCDLAPGKMTDAADLAEYARKRKLVDAKCGTSGTFDRHDIHNFTTRGYGSDFRRKDDERQVLRRMYYYLYFFIGHNQEVFRSLWLLVLQVYFPKEISVGDLAVGLHDFYDLDEKAIVDASKAISGLYLLYRYGEVTQGTPEVIRSVVRMGLRDTGVRKRLGFLLHYLGGDYRAKGERHDIEGVIFPRSDTRFFTAANDAGTKNSPCLLILDRQPGQADLTGLMLRQNTLGKTAATRVFLKLRSSGKRDETARQLDTLYQELKPKAEILSLKDRTTQREIAPFEELIDNKVDMKRSFMLTGWR